MDKKINQMVDIVKIINHDTKRLNEILRMQNQEEMYMALLRFHTMNISLLSKRMDTVLNDRWNNGKK